MTGLHPSLRPALALLPQDRPLALLTRHSVRETSPNGVASYDLPLTPEGVALAEAWGAELKRPVHSFHSSPVGRCMDTASAMARGAGLAEVDIRSTFNLVEPGCYVQSIGHVGPLFLQLGPLAFANRHLRENLDGILSPEAGGAKLLRHLYENQGPVGSLSIHVTHDTILAAFIYHLMGRQHLDEDDWPWMMEGAWLWFDDHNTIRWIWRGELGQKDVSAYKVHSFSA